MRAPLSFVPTFVIAGLIGPGLPASAQEQTVQPPKGFVAIFDGKDVAGWHGMPHFDPRKLAAMSDADRATQIARWTEDAKQHWTVKEGDLVNDGHGAYAAVTLGLVDC